MTDFSDRDRVAQLRERLATELAELEAELTRFRSDRAGETGDDEHDPDGIPLSAVWQGLESARKRTAAELQDADTALSHWDLGVYGVCEVCGSRIPEGRLEARPAARTCVTCSTARR